MPLSYNRKGEKWVSKKSHSVSRSFAQKVQQDISCIGGEKKEIRKKTEISKRPHQRRYATWDYNLKETLAIRSSWKLLNTIMRQGCRVYVDATSWRINLSLYLLMIIHKSLNGRVEG